jgi:hypothetical protein
LLISMFLVAQAFRRAGLQRLGLYSTLNGVGVLVVLLLFLIGLGTSQGLTGVVNRVFVVLALSWYSVLGLWLFRRGRGRGEPGEA